MDLTAYFQNFFIESIDILLPVLNKLLNRFQSEYFSPCWGHSNIIPLHEKGAINDTNNYRDISSWMSLAIFMFKLSIGVLHFTLTSTIKFQKRRRDSEKSTRR